LAVVAESHDDTAVDVETGVARQRGGGGPADSAADDVGEQVRRLRRDDQDDNAARVCECGFRGAKVERWWMGWFPRHECRMLNVGGCGGRGCRSNGRHQSRHSTAHTLYWNGSRHSNGCIKYNGYCICRQMPRKRRDAAGERRAAVHPRRLHCHRAAFSPCKGAMSSRPTARLSPRHRHHRPRSQRRRLELRLSRRCSWAQPRPLQSEVRPSHGA